jgi:hypothetical protein
MGFLEIWAKKSRSRQGRAASGVKKSPRWAGFRYRFLTRVSMDAKCFAYSAEVACETKWIVNRSDLQPLTESKT